MGIHLAGGESRHTLKQGCSWDKSVHQARAEIQQGLSCHWDQIPQKLCIFSGNSSRRPAGFNIPGKKLQNLTKRQVGIPDASVRIAITVSNNQVYISSSGFLWKRRTMGLVKKRLENYAVCIGIMSRVFD